MSTLTQICERMRQNRHALRRPFSGGVPTPASASARLAAQYLPGDRVFDRVTGQEGMALHDEFARAERDGEDEEERRAVKQEPSSHGLIPLDRVTG